MKLLTAISAATLLASPAIAQNCPQPSGNVRPSLASGYSLSVVASRLAKPRGIAFDSEGHLLVVEQDIGVITSHVINEDNGCPLATNANRLTEDGLNLNHAIQLNGTQLYASNANSIYRWSYDIGPRRATNMEELVTNMNNSGHTTRTLQLSVSAPGMMVVSRGSDGNLDMQATTIEGGTAQVKAFNLGAASDILDFDNDGILLAWGVRNEVGLAEHPETGGIWGVENSADQITRNGQDVSNNNPAEELNFFGYLSGDPGENQGQNFGYPWCLTAWDLDEIPNNENLTVGDQFAFDAASTLDNQNKTDEYCNGTVSPRLGFQAHMAPMDIKFNNSATEAWISFRGSWDRDDPIGYRLSIVQFDNGEPVEPSDSTTAENIILRNEDDSACPDDCFRPVGLAFDSQGRLFMSSDATGEIYVITRDPSATGTSSSASSATSSSLAVINKSWSVGWGLTLAVLLSLF